MENSYNHIDDLIGKYLAGESSPEESNLVESWLSENESNRRYFNQLKVIFARAAAITEVQHFDTDAAWNNLKSKINPKAEAKIVEMKPETNSFGLFLRIAASVISVLGAGFFAYQFLKKDNVVALAQIEIVTESKTEADTLPDGSEVFLNKSTKLAYEFDKKKKEHVVKLKGEAYFSIHHEKHNDFVVKVEDVFVKDVGTSFNVKAYPESNTIEVFVEEGEVMFYTDKDSGVYLKANGKGVYDKITKKFYIEQPEANTTAYKTRFFSFTDTDLQTVVNNVNAVYDKKITISPNLANCRLTVTFDNESVEEIAGVIAETLNLNVKQTSQGISLEGLACEQ
jgi:transmembrane sensor